MKDQLVDFKTAKMLKGLGFDENCFGYYSDEKGSILRIVETEKINGRLKNIIQLSCYLAPTWQQVEKWIWKKHKYMIEILFPKKKHEFKKFDASIWADGYHVATFYGFKSPIKVRIEMLKYSVRHIRIHKKLPN